MTQYRLGTISVTFGSRIVTGQGTAWTDRVTPLRDLLSVGAEDPVALIAAVVSDTELLLEEAWAGTSRTGATYAIMRDFDPATGAPLMAPGDVNPHLVYNRGIMRVGQSTAVGVASLEAVQQSRAARDAAQAAAQDLTTVAASIEGILMQVATAHANTATRYIQLMNET